VNELRQVDIAQLQRLAKALVQSLPARVVIGLQGTLGAGKTRLVQAFATEAGVDSAVVTSPTFTLVQHYRGDRLIHHIDAYRLADEDEFIELGGEELLEDEATVFIEWPERIAACLPRDVLLIDIEVDDDPLTRTIHASCRDDTLMAAASKAFAMAADDGPQRSR